MKFYVLKYADGSLVGIDQSSGGYPWPASLAPDFRLHGVEMWPFTEAGKKKALEYSRGEFTLAILEYHIKDAD